jgi:hypothetical protein
MLFMGLQRWAAALAVAGTMSAALQIDQSNSTLPMAIHDITHETINLNGFNMRVLLLALSTPTDVAQTTSRVCQRAESPREQSFSSGYSTRYRVELTIARCTAFPTCLMDGEISSETS